MPLAKKIAYYGLFIIVSLLFLLSLLSLVHHSDRWFVQILNFPRITFLTLSLICLIIIGGFFRSKKVSFYLLITALAISVAIHAYNIFPYSPLGGLRVLQSTEGDGRTAFSIIVANVKMTNSHSEKLVDIVDKQSPDIFLAMEVNKRWVNDLEHIHVSYPYRILFPTNNTYGMALYSKLPLQNGKILFFNHDSVPSFSAIVNLNGKAFQLLTVHPVAPKPSSHPDNINDKEVGLIKAAKTVAQSNFPVVVAGDFNDVGWSSTLARFEEISKLNDIRCGRGFFNTFHTKYFFMRWPLDYIYVSPHFRVKDIERLPAFGSDHFPFFATLTL